MPRFESRILEGRCGDLDVSMEVLYTMREDSFTVNRVDIGLVIGTGGVEPVTDSVREWAWNYAETVLERLLEQDEEYVDVYDLFEEEEEDED